MSEEIIGIYPYVDKDNIIYSNLIYFVDKDENYIQQVETGRLYEDAIDIYPSKFHYIKTNIVIPKTI